MKKSFHKKIFTLPTSSVAGFILLVLLCAISSGEEVQNAQKNIPLLTMSQAESIAIAQNTDVLSAKAQYEKTAAAYLSAWSSFLPSASASASWRRYDKEMISFRNDEMFYSKDSYSLGLSASLPIFSGGKDFLSLKQMGISRDVAFISYLDKISQVSADVISYYLAVVQSSMEIEIAQQSLDRALEEQKTVDEKLSLGSASEVEASKMRVQVAQKKLALIQAQNNLQRNREKLCAKLNFPLDTSFVVDTTLSPPPVVKIPPLTEFLSDIENRTVKQAKLNLRIARLERTSSYLNYLPRLSLSANWSWNGADFPDNFSSIADEGSFSYGLSLSWTLFSGTSRIGEIKSASANFLQNSATLDNTTILAEQNVREAYRTMTEAAASFELSKAQVEDAKLTLSATKKRYELGSATLLELLDAELSLEQAQLQKISAIVGYYRARAQLQYLTGK